MTEVTSSKNINTNNMQEINDIQHEIETYTKKIEHEKINLRLANERLQKQLNTCLSLQGKQIPKTKEQKEKEKKEKEKEKERNKYKKRELYQPPKKKEDHMLEKPYIINNEICKNENELDRVYLFLTIRSLLMISIHYS